MNFDALISSYNRNRRIFAFLNLLGGLLAYFFAYCFFFSIPKSVCHNARLEVDERWFTGGSITCLILITISGYIAWKNNREALRYDQSIDQSFLTLGGDNPTTGAVVVDYYASQVTAPAFVLSRLFLAGPTCLLKIQGHLNATISNDPATQNDLRSTYDVIKTNGKWHSLKDYVAKIHVPFQLAQLKLVDLDPIKGRIKVAS